MAPSPTLIYNLKTHPHYDAEECRHQEYLRRCMLATHFSEQAVEHQEDLPEASQLYDILLKYNTEWIESQLVRPSASSSNEPSIGPCWMRRTELWRKEWEDIVQGRTGPTDWIWPSCRYRFLYTEEENQLYARSTPVSSIRGPSSRWIQASRPSVWGDATEMDGARSFDSLSNQPYNRVLAGIDPPARGGISISSSVYEDEIPPPTAFASYPHFLDYGRPLHPSPHTEGKFEIINHHHIESMGTYLYCMVYYPLDPHQRPKSWWAKLSELRNEASLVEKYHVKHKLGAVNWPSPSLPRMTTSASRGIEEIVAALDKRKEDLKKRGDWNEVTQRIHREERWIMRNEWQRMGRSWGAAIEVVNMRGKMWEDMDMAWNEIRLLDRAGSQTNASPQAERSGALPTASLTSPTQNMKSENYKATDKPDSKADGTTTRSPVAKTEPVNPMPTFDGPASFDGGNSEQDRGKLTKPLKGPGKMELPRNEPSQTVRRKPPLPSPLPFRGYPEWASCPDCWSPSDTSQSGYFNYQRVPATLFHSGPIVYRVSPDTSRDSSFEHIDASWGGNSDEVENTPNADSRQTQRKPDTNTPAERLENTRSLDRWLNRFEGASKGHYFYGKRGSDVMRTCTQSTPVSNTSNSTGGARKSKHVRINLAGDGACDMSDEDSEMELHQTSSRSWVDGVEDDSDAGEKENLWLDGAAESKVTNGSSFESDYFLVKEGSSSASTNDSLSRDSPPRSPNINVNSDGASSPTWPAVYKDIQHEHKRERNQLRRFMRTQSDSHHRLDDVLGEDHSEPSWMGMNKDTVGVDEASRRIEEYIQEKARRVSEQTQRLQALLLIPSTQLTKDEAAELHYLQQRYFSPISNKTSACNSRSSSLHRGRTPFRSNISSPGGVFAMSPMDSTMINSRFHQHHLANLPAYLDGQTQPRGFDDPDYMDFGQKNRPNTPPSEGSTIRGPIMYSTHFVAAEPDNRGRHRLRIPAGWEPPAFLTTDCGCKLSHPAMTCSLHIKHWTIFLGHLSNQMNERTVELKEPEPSPAQEGPSERLEKPTTEPSKAFPDVINVTAPPSPHESEVDPLTFHPFKNPFPGMQTVDPMFEQGIVGVVPPADTGYSGDSNNDSAAWESSSTGPPEKKHERKSVAQTRPVPVRPSLQRPRGGMGRRVSSASVTRSALLRKANSSKLIAPRAGKRILENIGAMSDEDEARYSELSMRP